MIDELTDTIMQTHTAPISIAIARNKAIYTLGLDPKFIREIHK